jgi:predicted RNA-binding protein with PIN domain
MRYLIDGYNLAHALGLLTARAPRALLRARRALLARLAEHADPAGVTIVFDALKAPPGTRGGQDHRGVRVLFARGQSADDAIEEIIRADPSPRDLAVVSDDRRLREAARRRGCVSVGCLDYWERLGRPASPTPPAPAPEAPAKPEACSGEEAEYWLGRFDDVEDDPQFRDGF